jgi:XRE family aerobic/anaerobic benzoate catabolism transcriptional regulator
MPDMPKAAAGKVHAKELARKPAPGLLESVGARIRALREAKNQSRRELALAAGLSERFLADLEAGQGNISLARFDALGVALGTSAANLLSSAGKRGSKSIKKSASNLEKAELDALLAGLTRADHREALDWLRARFGHARGPMIALLGLRGAGKSTVGQALAKKLGVPFVELDARVEAAAGLSLAGIFSLHGEDYYRRLAREVLTRLLSELDAAVIATGGSIVTDPQALRLLTRRCRTVWLQATPEDHWRRVLAQGDERPGAASGNAQAELRALLQAREPLYSQAEVKVDTSKLGISGAVEAVVRAL